MAGDRTVCFADATAGGVSLRAGVAPYGSQGDDTLELVVEDWRSLFRTEVTRDQLREFCREVLSSEQMKEAP